MVTRAVVAAVVTAIFLVGCAEDPKRRTPPQPPGPICRGLSEVQCNANSQCAWQADKKKCKNKQPDLGEGSEQADPDLDKELKNPNR